MYQRRSAVAVWVQIPPGLHVKNNIQIICSKCNSSKNNKTHNEYININRDKW